jgi:hypothetical protein
MAAAGSSGTFAAETGTNLPWEGPLTTLVTSLTGPVAYAISVKALIPLENKRDFLEVSGDIVEHVDPVFFSDPMMAATKALGMT